MHRVPLSIPLLAGAVSGLLVLTAAPPGASAVDTVPDGTRAPGTVGAAAVPDEDAGLSTPRRDSYYPAYGTDGIDVLHYDLDLDWRRVSRTLHGDATLRVRATRAAGSFRLDLNGSMTVGRVRVDGVAAPYRHSGRVLTVETDLARDQRITVRIGYRGRPRPVPAPTTRSDFHGVGMRVTRDGQLRTMQEPFGALTWYPANDHPSDKALYDIRVSAPKGFVGVSNGRLLRRHDGRARTTTTWRMAHPAATYLTTLAVGPYVRRTDTGPRGLPLQFWMPRGTVERHMRVLRHTAADLRWLESKLGRYPFESAGVVIVPGGSAMETQTMVTYGAQLWGPQAREIMVHEWAHQWYGDTVTPDDWSELWLNEGMAMYLEARWTVEKQGWSWAQWRRAFNEANRTLRPDEGPPGAYHRDRFAETCVYFCTAAMFEQLRRDVGDPAFWQLVRRWPQEHRDANADRRDYEAWVEQRIGRDLTRFFRNWLTSPTWPPA